MSAHLGKFWSGICRNPRCGKPYVRKSCRPPEFCNDRCRKGAWQDKQREYDKQCRALGVVRLPTPPTGLERLQRIEAQIASGELTLVPGNACKTCEHKVEIDTDPLTGRTWERCACGTRFIGRWVA